MKSYVVATNTAFTILCLANDKDHAKRKADKYYLKEYGENRNDWEVYELNSWLEKDEAIILTDTNFSIKSID